MISTFIKTVTTTVHPEEKLDVSYPLNRIGKGIAGAFGNRGRVAWNALRRAAVGTVTDAMRRCAALPGDIAHRAAGGLKNIGDALHQMPDTLNKDLKAFEGRLKREVKPLRRAVEAFQGKVDGIADMSAAVRKTIQHGIVSSTKQAALDLRCQTKTIAYHAKRRAIEAGSAAVQGTEAAATATANAAANAASKVTKEVASRTGQVARDVESACHAAFGQLATQIKSRQDEPENYQYVEREGFHHEAFDPESCASTLGGIGEQCKEDHDVDTAYRDIYSRASYLSQQDVPPQTQEVFSVDCQEFLLFMAQLYLNNLPKLREHQQAKDTDAFTTVIFSMREQVFRWDPQQECRASFD